MAHHLKDKLIQYCGQTTLKSIGEGSTDATDVKSKDQLYDDKLRLDWGTWGILTLMVLKQYLLLREKLVIYFEDALASWITGHWHQYHWLCGVTGSLSTITKISNQTCHLNIEKSQQIQIFFSVSYSNPTHIRVIMTSFGDIFMNVEILSPKNQLGLRVRTF